MVTTATVTVEMHSTELASATTDDCREDSAMALWNLIAESL
jgi:hypothetical protein